MQTIKTFLSTFVLLIGVSISVYGQNIRQQVENGVQNSIRYTENNLWKEAFDACRATDDAISNYERSNGKQMPELHFLVAKERMRMYRRLGKKEQSGQWLSRMYELSQQASSADVKEEFLLTKADYLNWVGKRDASDECYKQIVSNHIKGKSNTETENVYKQLLQRSKNDKQPSFTRILERLYSEWQDSIAAVKASDDLKALQGNYAKAQEEISDQDSKIGWQRALIVILVIIAIALAGVLVFGGAFLAKSLMQIKKLKSSLALANENNEQKGAFIDKLGDHLAPSLDAIEKGGVKENVKALRSFLGNIRKYMQLEITRDEHYDTEDVDLQSVCGKIIDAVKQQKDIRQTIKVDVPRISFKANKEALTEVITGVIGEAADNASTEAITLAFKKTSAKSGKFLVTASGMSVTDEERALLFKPFAKVRDITKGDGMCLPTCTLIAFKMNGSLSLDEEYHRGVRFVLELHN